MDIHGLKGAPEYNGASGRIVAAVGERLEVQLDSHQSKTLRVKRANVFVRHWEPATEGGVEARAEEGAESGATVVLEDEDGKNEETISTASEEPAGEEEPFEEPVEQQQRTAEPQTEGDTVPVGSATPKKEKREAPAEPQLIPSLAAPPAEAASVEKAPAAAREAPAEALGKAEEARRPLTVPTGPGSSDATQQQTPIPPPPVPAPVPALSTLAPPVLNERPLGSQFFCAPCNLGFCHDTVSAKFRSGVGLRETLGQLLGGDIRKRDVEMMRVVLHEGHLHSLSNRRLTLYRLLQMAGRCQRVKVELVAKDGTFRRKYTTKCQGAEVVIRETREVVGRDKKTTTFRHPAIQAWRP